MLKEKFGTGPNLPKRGSYPLADLDGGKGGGGGLNPLAVQIRCETGSEMVGQNLKSENVKRD